MLTYKKPEDKDPHILITRIVNGEIDNTFKDKRFEVTSIVYGISNKVRSATFRVSRVVAANDRL